jgi:uncharacterized protein
LTSSIEIKNLKRKDGYNKKIDLSGGTVLDGLPSSTGLVNAIASECLIRSTGTELVAFLDSPDFPPLSVVTNYVPQYPIRIYVNENLKVAFFVSDINIDKLLQRDVANAILEWTRKNQCKLIISAQGIQLTSSTASQDDKSSVNESQNGKNASKSNQNGSSQSPAHYSFPTDSYAVTSTESAARLIVGHGNYFSHLRSGTITGIPAILLNEGALTNLDVIVFLVNALPDIPDFRAAAAVSEAVSKIVPTLSCDIGSLMVEAQLIETRMKNVRDEHRRTSYIA